MKNQKQKHQPVLLRETLQYLQPKSGESYLDVTAGYGGHAKEIVKRTKAPEKTVLIDRDEQSVSVLTKHFAKAQIIHDDFLSASGVLAGNNKRFDMILADLGVSSPQLDDADRGFSIKNSGPLDMRMDQGQDLTAKQILNTSSSNELTEIFSKYGEEPKARKIAEMVIHARPLKSTDQLAVIAAKVWPGHSRIHPATRVFQALRIAVNGELNQLEESLPTWFELLAPGGRLAVISFHSLEDRIVKQFFGEHSSEHYGGELKVLTKKPIAADKNEIVFNPRARSAKLRAAAKIKTK